MSRDESALEEPEDLVEEVEEEEEEEEELAIGEAIEDTNEGDDSRAPTKLEADLPLAGAVPAPQAANAEPVVTIQMLTALLKSDDRDQHLRAANLLTTVNAAQKDEIRDLLVQELRSTQPFVRLLNMKEKEYHLAGAKSLFHLALWVSAAREHMFREGAIARAVELVSTSPDPLVQDCAAGLIAALSFDTVHREPLVTAGAIPPLLSLLGKTDEDSRRFGVRQAALALSFLLGVSDAVRRTALDGDVVPSLVRLLASSTNQLTVRYAASALGALCTNPYSDITAAARAQILREGGVRQLVRLVAASLTIGTARTKTGPVVVDADGTRVQHAVLRALCAVCAGGLATPVAANVMSTSTPTVDRESTPTAIREVVGVLGGIQALVDHGLASPKMECRAEAARVLLSLCQVSSTNRVTAIAEGAVCRLVALLRDSTAANKLNSTGAMFAAVTLSVLVKNEGPPVLLGIARHGGVLLVAKLSHGLKVSSSPSPVDTGAAASGTTEPQQGIAQQIQKAARAVVIAIKENLHMFAACAHSTDPALAFGCQLAIARFLERNRPAQMLGQSGVPTDAVFRETMPGVLRTLLEVVQRYIEASVSADHSANTPRTASKKNRALKEKAKSVVVVIGRRIKQAVHELGDDFISNRPLTKDPAASARPRGNSQLQKPAGAVSTSLVSKIKTRVARLFSSSGSSAAADGFSEETSAVGHEKMFDNEKLHDIVFIFPASEPQTNGSSEQPNNAAVACGVDRLIGGHVDAQGRRIIYAHRVILTARSEYFSTMLLGDMKESREKEVPITDVPYPLFRRMIFFLYAGHVDIASPEDAMSLAVVADRYQISSLKASCEGFLVNYVKSRVANGTESSEGAAAVDTSPLPTEEIAALVEFSETYRCLLVERACIDYLALHIHRIRKDSGLQALLCKDGFRLGNLLFDRIVELIVGDADVSFAPPTSGHRSR